MSPRAWLLAAALGLVPAAVAAATPGQETAARHAADGMRLAQARYCGLAQEPLSRIAEALRDAARREARARGEGFDEAAYGDAFRRGAREMDAILQRLPANPERDRDQCREVRAELDALQAPH
ncbi:MULTISPECIES: hypothetical protein [Lysobacter]|uniref:Uncharacterized protein n=1 Tax=Lysobacter firmicutimachus TaxID=1792846 RepID=A0ABU8D9G0_9GAMM|nr:hypothetical protein [Lysobacter antibioticus]